MANFPQDTNFPQDIYAEPAEIDPDTLANLGPLAPLAGLWEGLRGLDVKPKAEGAKKQTFVERMALQPIDPQTNGPQLLYGLRYHIHIVKPDQVKTYHDQVGYWLWEPATGTIMQTLTIPRGQIAMAMGHAAAGARAFELVATRGDEHANICANPFLDHAFQTVEYRIRIAIHDDGTWEYDQDTVLRIQGQPELFHHTDRNRLSRIGGPPVPNPMVAGNRSTESTVP